ncbi:hypothetical protein O3M35_009529 [Rhynocoris fuscipes]|uniref:Dynein regulatory complex protein 1/2 N-terminal domain-containing protein n=1 Tax=Rhynocoris fuscipes TaxID=488301 RepID=A0AAW1DAU2_9HEMI
MVLSAEKKAAKQRAKDQKAITERKLQFTREMIYSRANIDKLQEKMERLAEKKYFNFVHGDSMHEWKLFVWLMTAKDRYISALNEEIEHHDERMRVAKQLKAEICDEIIRLYDEELRYMKKTYLRLREKYVRERFDFIIGFNRRTQNYFDEVCAYEHDLLVKKQDEYNAIRTSMMTQFGMFDTECKIQERELKVSIEHKILKLWNEYEDIIENYKKSTFRQRTDIVLSSIKEAKSRKILDKLNKSIAEVSVKIEIFLENYPGEKLKKTLSYLECEKSKYKKPYNMFRIKLKKIHEEDDRKLHDLSVASNEPIKLLKETLEKIEPLLKYMNVSHKFETEVEKTLPIEDIDCCEYFPEGGKFDHFKIMWKLYYRRSQVSVQNEFLQKIYDEEKKETYRLRKLIEFVIHNFDIGLPEIKSENQFVLDNIKNL